MKRNILYAVAMCMLCGNVAAAHQEASVGGIVAPKIERGGTALASAQPTMISRFKSSLKAACNIVLQRVIVPHIAAGVMLFPTYIVFNASGDERARLARVASTTAFLVSSASLIPPYVRYLQN